MPLTISVAFSEIDNSTTMPTSFSEWPCLWRCCRRQTFNFSLTRVILHITTHLPFLCVQIKCNIMNAFEEGTFVQFTASSLQRPTKGRECMERDQGGSVKLPGEASTTGFLPSLRVWSFRTAINILVFGCGLTN